MIFKRYAHWDTSSQITPIACWPRLLLLLVNVICIKAQLLETYTLLVMPRKTQTRSWQYESQVIVLDCHKNDMSDEWKKAFLFTYAMSVMGANYQTRHHIGILLAGITTRPRRMISFRTAFHCYPKVKNRVIDPAPLKTSPALVFYIIYHKHIWSQQV